VPQSSISTSIVSITPLITQLMKDETKEVKEKGRERNSCRASILSHFRPSCFVRLELVIMVTTVLWCSQIGVGGDGTYTKQVAASHGQSRVTSGLAGATTRCTSGDTIPRQCSSFLRRILCTGRTHCHSIYGDFYHLLLISRRLKNNFLVFSVYCNEYRTQSR